VPTSHYRLGLKFKKKQQKTSSLKNNKKTDKKRKEIEAGFKITTRVAPKSTRHNFL
jgi:hypothetical protein